jgi:hypothetical protein
VLLFAAGETLLHLACAHGRNEALVQWLLTERKADVKAQTKVCPAFALPIASLGLLLAR